MAITDYKAKEIRPNGGYCCPETSNCPRKSICNDLETKLSDAEKANAEMLSKVMTVNSENIALQSDLGTAEKKLSAANAEIKRLKKYIKSLTTDTFHNPNEI
jgi:chromosome segregation ATPase